MSTVNEARNRRYDVTINGKTYKEQWKRNSILLVVKALVIEIREFFRQMGRGTVFMEVPGEIQDVREFCSVAKEQPSLRATRTRSRTNGDGIGRHS